MKRISSIAALTAALILCIALAGCAQSSSGSSDSAITVSASATSKVSPDKATLGILIDSSGDTLEAARSQADQTIGHIKEALSLFGVSGDNIQVSEVNTSERYGGPVVERVPSGWYDWDGNWIEDGYEEIVIDEGGAVVGYDISSRILVSGFAADSIASIVKEAASLGAVGYDSLVFKVSDHEAAYKQALSAAVDASHEKAEALAKASGVYVGRVVNMEELSSADFDDEVEGDASGFDASDDASLDVRIPEIEVEASVIVSYAIQ